MFRTERSPAPILAVKVMLFALGLAAAGCLSTPAVADDDPPSPEELCWESYLSRVETCIRLYGLELQGKIDPEVRRMAAAHGL